MYSLGLSVSRFVDAMLFVERVSGRLCEDSLNRGAKHIIIGSGTGPGAMQLTPKADRAKIAAVPLYQIKGFIISKLKKSGKWPVSNSEVERLAERERRRRQSSVGYAAYAGYHNAAKKFGGTGLKRGVTDAFDKSEASRGYGSKATKTRLEAILSNTAPAIERIGEQALAEAINNAAEDLEVYGNRKFHELFAKL